MRLIDAAFIVLFLCLGPLGSTEVASAGGSIGCLFYSALCKGKTEKCFDDNVFGRCISYKDPKSTDFYRYKLNAHSLNLVKKELNRLIKLGYRWSHMYTQCVLKNVLFAIRYHKKYNEEDCRIFADADRPIDRYFEENPEELDPKTVGQVQFTPSVVDPHAEFADEIYIPILEKDEDDLEDVVIPIEDLESQREDNYDSDFERSLLLKEINKNKRGKYETDGNNLDIFARVEANENVVPSNYYDYLSESPRRKETIEIFKDGIAGDFIGKYRSDEDTDDGIPYGELLGNIFDTDRSILKSFSRNYNTPEKFRDGHEMKDEVVYPKGNRMNEPVGVFYSPEERRLAYDVFNMGKNEGREKDEDAKKSVFTEGGVVYLKNDNKGDKSRTFDEVMNTYGNWGFKRPERLDVKKPGPLSTTINQALQRNKAGEKETEGSKSAEIKTTTPKPAETFQPKTLVNQPEKKKGGSPMESPSLRRQTTTVQPSKEKDADAADNSEFAYMKLKNRINTWQEGSRIVRKVEDILNLKQNTFSNIRVDQNDVRFKVEPNRNLNASEVVRRIETLKDFIQRATGIEIVSTGVGNQNNLPPSMSLLGGDERQLWFVSFLLCGLIAAVAIIGAVVFVIKRHPSTIDKLEDLAQMDSEASKDYQELCRARMASKAAQEKPEGNVGGHRVTNLTKEAEASNHSPSSRSSTSSWSEEPALTNMDISTGHMVLSYMEDHLKNKDRLEQEWIALCAYEAEPCATTIALKGDNAKKNRYNDVLPYDHARVVLNELSNITGSDYINASTITDHDPRNPAYIASQGPLQQTTADFWQMIWEQGSVVMVMLTRLTENGTAMCHRYWPEEGSELYHIYEVHLVSEHIWCDDYLVRSFYLKNIKTSETRTVTQFHFLSWPENGVPLSTKALLEFRRKVNKSYRGRSCPVVVHCSDGVGRTGTYCLIDMVLNRMAKGAKEIDIAATLEHIRDQRPMMVKTKQQFEFVLMAVAEEVHAILKALPATLNHSPPPVVKEKE